VLAPPEPLPLLAHLLAVAVDEVDECFATAPSELAAVMAAAMASSAGKPQVVLVGATVEAEEVALAKAAGWLSADAVDVRGGGTGAPGGAAGASRVPSGLRHRYLVAEEGQALPLLAQMLRRDLAEAGASAGTVAAGGPGAADGGPGPRAIVFVGSEEAARALAEPLRDALWAQHRLAVLLPGGAEPIRAMHAFRDGEASLLLCTPAASRGLDLPAVSHVYNVGVPEDGAQYLHRAGRAGRIGSLAGGVVTSIVAPEQLPALRRFAGQLGIALEEAEPGPPLPAADGSPDGSGGGGGGGPPPPPPDLDTMRKGLEDLFRQ